MQLIKSKIKKIESELNEFAKNSLLDLKVARNNKFSTMPEQYILFKEVIDTFSDGDDITFMTYPKFLITYKINSLDLSEYALLEFLIEKGYKITEFNIDHENARTQITIA